MLDAAKTKDYAFMQSPSPAPGVDDSPFMTWGEIEGTPMLIGGQSNLGDSGPGPKFTMQALPTREQIGLNLSKQSGVRAHKKKQARIDSQKRVNTHTPGSMVRMSPAARKLLESRRASTPHGGLSGATDSALRASYMGTPRGLRPSPLTLTGHSGTDYGVVSCRW
jgi:hypothetical protein